MSNAIVLGRVVQGRNESEIGFDGQACTSQEYTQHWRSVEPILIIQPLDVGKERRYGNRPGHVWDQAGLRC